MTNSIVEPDCEDGQSCASMYYYHSDHLGSSTYLTDESGTPRQYLLYLPFGETMLDQKAGGYDSRYKYTGKETDENTGLNYHGARYYNPSISMWYGVDPLIEDYPAWSPFNYVMGNPIRLIDPTGMSSENGDGVENEYEIIKINGVVRDVKFISNKGGDVTDYVKEINITTDCNSECKEETITQYQTPVNIEYTSGPGRNPVKEGTPGSRLLHGKKPTDLVAYGVILSEIYAAFLGIQAAGLGTLGMVPRVFSKGTSATTAANAGRGLWELTKEGASAIKSHKTFGTFYKSTSDGLWWAVDKAGHGGSKFKVFKESKMGLEWFKDADEFGNFILNKHNGSTGMQIPWNHLSTTK